MGSKQQLRQMIKEKRYAEVLEICLKAMVEIQRSELDQSRSARSFSAKPFLLVPELKELSGLRVSPRKTDTEILRRDFSNELSPSMPTELHRMPRPASELVSPNEVADLNELDCNAETHPASLANENAIQYGESPRLKYQEEESPIH
jgi:hypothetical protein